MISFNNLGNLGHLGNQMFQYASLKGISKNRGYEYCIPDKKYFGTRYNLFSNIHDCFNINCNVGFITEKTINERFYHFDKDLFENCPDNVNLNGYFQSEKYFKHIKDEIKKDFSFSKEVISECKTLLNSLQKSEEWISLHSSKMQLFCA